jgi:hypothetical protein
MNAVGATTEGRVPFSSDPGAEIAFHSGICPVFASTIGADRVRCFRQGPGTDEAAGRRFHFHFNSVKPT